MSLSNVREELIAKVPEGKGRDEYAEMMHLIPDTLAGLEGHLGEHLYIRLIKGAQRLQLKRALLTYQGMATEDGVVVDCGAALVTLESGTAGGVPYDVKRFAGKESEAVHRLRTSYDPVTLQFGLGTDDVPEKTFPASLLNPHSHGRIVRASMGGDILQGILCMNELLMNHIRACLADHVKDASKIELLLRQRAFTRVSDTAQSHQLNIHTLFTDGSQLHVWNRETGRHESGKIGREIPDDANRPNVIIEGIEIHPFVEDLIGAIRIRTASGQNPVVEFADMTPRCAVPQRDVLTGEMIDGQPMKYRVTSRPHVPVGASKTLKPTAGVNAHVEPETIGRDGVLIEGGAEFAVLGEKTALKR